MSQVILVSAYCFSILQLNAEGYRAIQLYDLTRDPLLSPSKNQDIDQITKFKLVVTSRNMCSFLMQLLILNSLCCVWVSRDPV